MKIDALQLLHNASKSSYKPVSQLPSDYWPDEWKTVYYKEYPRFTVVELPEPCIDNSVTPLVVNRKSERKFSQTGLTISDISNILKYSCGELIQADGSTHRAQPSGGARYAVEVYPIVRFSDSSELASGAYHYNVKNHTLEYMWSEDRAGVDPKTLVQDPWALQASVMFIMTAVFWRSKNKYRARSYRYICMEAGAILQNAYLFASGTKMKVVGYGGTYDDKIEQLLRLDTRTESVIGAFLVGK